MTFKYSRPIEELIEKNSKPGSGGARVLDHVDVLIIGSGYGGSVAAFRMAGLRDDIGRDLKVMVLERGKEYLPGDFPNYLGDLPGHVRFQRPSDDYLTGYPDALFDIRIGENVDVLVGSGLGGTSLINANVAARPDESILQSSQWPEGFDAASLDSEFSEIESWLGVEPANHHGADRPKYRALTALSDALNLQKPVEEANIAVTQGPQGGTTRNRADVEQPNCTNCGNCVTGCNVGAKNTLAMNLIPYAKHNGVEFYTGANVLDIKQFRLGRHRWRVRLRPTATMRFGKHGRHYYIDARIVILAAGTFGSTEILKRSTQEGHLSTSSLLGQHFSTNGDGLALSVGQDNPVHAIGTPNIHDRENNVGPTITGITRGRAKNDNQSFTIEEGAIPNALTKIFGEIALTGATLQRLGSNKLPAWYKDRQVDPVAYDRDLLDHSQVLLLMTDDGAKMQLDFGENNKASLKDYQVLFPNWKTGKIGKSAKIVAAKQLNKIYKLLAKENLGAGFGFGQFVPNPLWELFPRKAASWMSGEFPGGRHVSVHPLGGCRMGNTIDDGVVDADGSVFRNSGGTYRGLYVMDGSVIPRALATNPFLTISAIAWRWCTGIIRDFDWQEAAVSPSITTATPPVYPVPDSDSVRLAISEQLVGQFPNVEQPPGKNITSYIEDCTDRLMEPDGLLIEVDIDSIDVHQEFAKQSREGFGATLRMYENTIPGKVTDYPSGTIKTNKPSLAEGRGHVSVLRLDRPVDKEHIKDRAKKAKLAYKKYRDREFGPPWSALPFTSRIAEMHANYRQFRYCFDIAAPGNTTIQILGSKIIQWHPERPRLLEALTKLPATFTVRRDNHELTAEVELAVNVGNMLDEGLLQVESSPNLPESTMSVLSLISYFGRSILQSSFWEFAAPTYPREVYKPDIQPKPLRVKKPYRLIKPEFHEFHVPLTRQESRKDPRLIKLRLLRYRQNKENRNLKPILLVHGLAQGSLIYNTHKIEYNMASYMWDKGYDVWLLDFRLSNSFRDGPDKIPFDSWTIDEIGQFDIPIAVETMLDTLKNEHPIGLRPKAYIFAHCVGAVATQMAILKGRLTRDDIAGVCFNAIHPWVIGSSTNIIRSKLGAFFRDWVSDDYLNPIIQSKKDITAPQSMIDRLAFSVARFNEDESDRHLADDGNNLSQAICDRMTFLYGRMWRHENLSHELKNGWRDIVGEAPSAVFRHLYYLLERGRLLNALGHNVYLRHSNIRRYWAGIPTAFIHGLESEVFNPISAVKSAVNLLRILRHGNDHTPVLFHRFDDYGHMDPILAKDAHDRSYSFVDNFFSTASPHQDNSVPEFRLAPDATKWATFDFANPMNFVTNPGIQDTLKLGSGPILRAAWLENGILYVRYWLEVWDMSTARAREVKFVGQHRPVAHLDGTSLLNRQGSSGRLDRRFQWHDCEIANNEYGNPEICLRSNAGDVYQDCDDLVADERIPPWVNRLGQARNDFNFLVGSCRYPGTPFEKSRSDAVFHGIDSVMMDKDHGIDALFLVGDQIYADATADLFDSTARDEKFAIPYRHAFSTPNARSVLSRIPVHFAIDDHEIRDDWSGENFKHRNFAVGQARSYMCSAREARGIGNAAMPARGSLWYALDHEKEGVFPSFVLDSRTERESGHDCSMTSMVGDVQLRAFRDWLELVGNLPQPKFVFAGQIITPITQSLHSNSGLWRNYDGFIGCPDSLGAILDHVLSTNVENLVFVGGDQHLSGAAKMLIVPHDGGPPITIWQIVASGLYAPMPFANGKERDFKWKNQCQFPLPRHEIFYDASLLTEHESHFVRVKTEPGGPGWRISVSAFNEKGFQLDPVHAGSVGNQLQATKLSMALD